MVSHDTSAYNVALPLMPSKWQQPRRVVAEADAHLGKQSLSLSGYWKLRRKKKAKEDSAVSLVPWVATDFRDVADDDGATRDNDLTDDGDCVHNLLLHVATGMSHKLVELIIGLI
jgi:hypothetical protein